MKVFITLYCLYAVVYGQQDSSIAQNEALITTNGTGKIINGIEAGRGQFPWQVGIFHTIGDLRQFCGGALISNQWILTAAHCVYRARDFEIILGATRAYDSEPQKISMRIEKALYHPNYNYPAKLNNDVAVIKLSERVTFNQYIRAIKLPRRGQVLSSNAWVVVSGWGKTSDLQSSIVNELNFVQLKTISNKQCRDYFIPSLIPDTVVCCDGSSYHSTCSGDSGGPLVMMLNNEWSSVGVVSFVSSSGCERGQPTGYARTESYLDFIESNTGIRTQ